MEALINALREIRDLPLNTDADVLRDTVMEAREIASKALQAEGVDDEGYDEHQPDEAQEWYDFDPDC